MVLSLLDSFYNELAIGYQAVVKEQNIGIVDSGLLGGSRVSLFERTLASVIWR